MPFPPGYDSRRIADELSRQESLRGLSTFRKEVLERGELEEYESGDTIYDKGDLSRGLFFLIRGSVALYRDKKLLTTLHADTHFGTYPVLRGEPTYTVRATAVASKNLVLVLSERDIFELAGEESFWRNLARTGTYRLEEQNKRSIASDRLIFPLHGIRTRGDWQKAFSEVAHDAGWKCRLEHWSFGRFSLLQFLSPWSRKAKVKWFRETYFNQNKIERLELDHGQYPCVVAHSFGTFVLGNALIKYPDIRLNKVILCGSILNRGFPWLKLIQRGQVQAVRNEYSRKDFWARIVRYLIPGTGSSGWNGFADEESECFIQIEYNFEHSEFFARGHVEANWIAFLDRDYPFKESIDMHVSEPPGDVPILGYGLLLATVFALLLVVIQVLV